MSSVPYLLARQCRTAAIEKAKWVWTVKRLKGPFVSCCRGPDDCGYLFRDQHVCIVRGHCRHVLNGQ